MEKQKRNQPEIGILGCGWLGMALGEALVKQGKIVRGSTRHEQRFAAIKERGISPYRVHCEEDHFDGIIPFLSGLDQLVIALPPGLRHTPKRRFDHLIQNLIPYIKAAMIDHVIFISSTSVYGAQEGSIDENTLPQPVSASGQQLLACEKAFSRHSFSSLQILRLGGLIGPNRHPIFTLAQKTRIKNPQGKINYIHQSDAVSILLACIQAPQFSGIFNGVCPYHPQRSTYFKQMAQLAGLVCPPMAEEQATVREISAEKVMSTFDYQFIVENLLTLN